MAATIKIDLSEQLGVGQYIEIRDPRLLPWGVQREIVTSLKNDSIDSQMDGAEVLVQKLVRNLNVFDEEGRPLTLPLSTEAIRQMPAPAVEAVASKFAELRKTGADVPKN